MKKYILAINLLALLMLISSCEDIVDADQNIRKTKINFHSVKNDQQNDVIMPLKIGNLWVYKVTEYNLDGSEKEIRYDSILVKQETLINGEKWFIVGLANKNSSNPDYLTNTDIGLYYKDHTNLNESYLLVEYPIKHSTYYLSEQNFPSIFTGSKAVYDDTLDNWTNAQVLYNYGMIYGDFTTYEYFIWGKFRNKTINTYPNTPIPLKLEPKAIEYYVPNVGMTFRQEFQLNPDNSQTLKSNSYLVYTNLKVGKPIKQTVFEIDFGTSPQGATSLKTVTKLFENDSDKDLIIKLIEIDKDPSFTIVNPPTIPFTIHPGESFGITVKFTPTAIGEFKSNLMFFNDDNTYLKVELKGTCQ